MMPMNRMDCEHRAQKLDRQDQFRYNNALCTALTTSLDTSGMEVTDSEACLVRNTEIWRVNVLGFF